MLSHFAAAARASSPGAASSGGMDMFLVGLGVAGIGYVVGEWIVRLL
jgi:hypothetical protein